MTRIRLALPGRVHHAVGLMSGTSHDGVSAAAVAIDERRRPRVRLLALATAPYSQRLRAAAARETRP